MPRKHPRPQARKRLARIRLLVAMGPDWARFVRASKRVTVALTAMARAFRTAAAVMTWGLHADPS